MIRKGSPAGKPGVLYAASKMQEVTRRDDAVGRSSIQKFLTFPRTFQSNLYIQGYRNILVLHLIDN